MKKYPYTESTDLIVYEEKRKKRKRKGVFLPCLISALVASILTGSIMTYYISGQMVFEERQM